MSQAVINSTNPSIQVKQVYVSAPVAALSTPVGEVNKNYPLPVKPEDRERSYRSTFEFVSQSATSSICYLSTQKLVTN